MSRKKLSCILLSCVLGTSVLQAATPQKTYGLSESVSVWLTKSDQTKLLTPQTNMTFIQDSGTNDHTIDVNENITYQQMDGFGASLTDASSWLIYNKLSSSARDTLMTNLFDKTTGIGISLLRQPMGASDYALNTYSYDDMPIGQTDSNLTNFSINHDSAYIIPVVKQALQKNSNIKIIATPWSAPGWMKSSGSMIGGSLNTSAYAAYANYFTKYVNAYTAQGLPIYGVTIQNEPEYTPSNYAGMSMSALEQANFIKNNLGPTFASNLISTKIMAYDHNWNDKNYPLSVLGDSGANPYVAGTAWHYYGGTVDAMTSVHDAYPAKDTWFTEGSGGAWIGNGSWHDNFNDHIMNAIRISRNWSKSVVWWNMALDENNGPTVLPSSTCYGVVTINQLTGAVSYNADYYTLGQFSKFVVPGAYRISSNSFDNDVEDVAFKNPDGSKVLVVNNRNTIDKSVKVKWGSESFTYTVPAESAITFKWSGSQTSISVTPVWYQNFETGNGFTAGTNAAVAIDSSSANTGGFKSVKLTTSVSTDPGSTAQCVKVTPQSGTVFDTSTYGYLNFYVKDTQGTNTVKLTFVDTNNTEYSAWTSASSVMNTWTKISFPTSSITGINKAAIKEIRVGEWNSGVYYFDDLYFSPDSASSIPIF